jgi:hypothetical protein
MTMSKKKFLFPATPALGFRAGRGRAFRLSVKCKLTTETRNPFAADILLPENRKLLA